jgi:hypothetical protein
MNQSTNQPPTTNASGDGGHVQWFQFRREGLWHVCYNYNPHRDKSCEALCGRRFNRYPHAQRNTYPLGNVCEKCWVLVRKVEGGI